MVYVIVYREGGAGYIFLLRVVQSSCVQELSIFFLRPRKTIVRTDEQIEHRIRHAMVVDTDKNSTKMYAVGAR